MSNVFPINMNPLPQDNKEAIKVLEEYIRYMKEQIEFTIGVINKLNGGTSLTDISIKISALQGECSSLNSRLSQVTSNVSVLQGKVLERVDTSPTTSTQGTIGAMKYNTTDDSLWICVNVSDNEYEWKSIGVS